MSVSGDDDCENGNEKLRHGAADGMREHGVIEISREAGREDPRFVLEHGNFVADSHHSQEHFFLAVRKLLSVFRGVRARAPERAGAHTVVNLMDHGELPYERSKLETHVGDLVFSFET